ncbi:hypothetical protein F5Y07DRAFT_394449 [Xylaria sp. FL0933]|nr:hypothetical protein F5Y07DRAFT_394449 [Xylaria sp. FL0933]
MDSPKRKRSVDRDDSSEHVYKKRAESHEEMPVHRATSAAPYSNHPQLAPQEQTSNSQDTETDGAAFDDPVEQPQDKETLAIPTDNPPCQQDAQSNTIVSDHALDSFHGKPSKHDDIIAQLQSRITVLEKDKSERDNAKNIATERDKAKSLRYKLKIREDELKLEKDKVETEKSKVEALRYMLKASQERLEAVQNKHQATTEQLGLAQKQIEQLSEDIELTGIAQQSAPDLDSALERQFRDLRKTIRSFTRECYDSKIPASSIPQDVRREFASLSGISASRFLGSSLHARYFIEGLVWHKLYIQFLENPFEIWGKGYTIGNLAERIRESSNKTIACRQLWRTMTGQLLNDSSILEPSKSKIRSWIEFLVFCLKPLIRDEYKDNIEDYIEPIVSGAIDIAKILAQSRTLCAIQRKEPGADAIMSQKYDARWMEIIEKSVMHFEDVDFIVSPALVQITNSAGDEFNPPRVIVKAEVCFGQGRTSTDIRPSPAKKPRTRTVASGREAREIDRLGEAADADQLNEAIGYYDETISNDEADDYDYDHRKKSRRN